MSERTDNPLDHPPDRQAFEQAVRCGLGRAVLWLSRGDIVADRDFILHACTHDFSYDRQCESNRALYMFDILQATGDVEYYARALERALPEVGEDDEDDRSVYQIFDLLGLLAQNGDLEARRSLYAFFEQRTEEDDYGRAEVFVNIDGLEGYLYIVRRWIQHPRDEDNHWYEAYLLEKVEERFGVEAVQTFLEQAARAEPAIGVYLSEAQEKRMAWKARRNSRPPRPQPNLSELRRLIFDPDKRFLGPSGARAGAKLSENDAEQLARELLAETDPQRLERYLFLFGRRPFPLDHAPLLTLARNAEQKIASAARAALSRIRHPSVRALALELIDADPRPWELVEMLTRNFLEGDEKVIERVLRKPWDAWGMHRIGIDILGVFEANTTPAAFGLLIYFYEQGFCTMCRHGAVEMLAKLGPPPDYILDECRFDAYDATRELIQERTQMSGKE